MLVPLGRQLQLWRLGGSGASKDILSQSKDAATLDIKQPQVVLSASLFHLLSSSTYFCYLLLSSLFRLFLFSLYVSSSLLSSCSLHSSLATPFG